MSTDPRDQELINQHQKLLQQKASTGTVLQPWQESLSRYATGPSAKSLEAAEVISGLVGSWAASLTHGMSEESVGGVVGESGPQTKTYKLGQPGYPEINFVPYDVGTNRFGPKGPSFLGHPISLSVVGPTLKSPYANWQWEVTDNSGTPGLGDQLQFDLADTAWSLSGVPIPPTTLDPTLGYNIPAGPIRDTYPGGLYMVVLQTGEPGTAPGANSGLSEGFIGDGLAAGKNPLVAQDPTARFEIFRVVEYDGTVVTLDPNKRLASYFTITAPAFLRQVLFFEPQATRLVAAPSSGARGEERAFLVVPPQQAARSEHMPPLSSTAGGSWVTGAFDVNDSSNAGDVSGTDYTPRTNLPIPRPLEHRKGRAQKSSDAVVAVKAGKELIYAVGSPTPSATDVGKLFRVYRTTRTGSAPFASPYGDHTTEDNFLGWFEVMSINTGPDYYEVRRVPEVDPATGEVFWGSWRSLRLDVTSLSGNLEVGFTVHEPISALHSQTYNDPDKLESARLTNLIDPDWVERSAKTPTTLEGISAARADKAIWDTGTSGTLGGEAGTNADPGSLMDLGFRMVLFPAKEGIGGYAGRAVPDYANPITSREVVLDPASTESQRIDIDYSSGVVTLSHTPVPGTGCDVAPNGVVASDNPREEIILYASCVPYSMEEGQLGTGVRVTSNSVLSGSVGAPQADLYGDRVVAQVAPFVDGVAQVITSGVAQVINLQNLEPDLPMTGFLELRVDDEFGAPAFVGGGGEPLGLFGYAYKTLHTDLVRLVNITKLYGVYGGASYGVSTIDASTTNLVVVLRKDIRTPVQVTGVAGTLYEHDLTYGFAKRSSTLRLQGGDLEYRPDGSLVMAPEEQSGVVTVGAVSTTSQPHFETLAEAVAYVGLVAEPAPGISGRSWKIQVIGPTNETATPILMPVDGIIIEGAMLRRAGGPGTQTTIRWSADTPLIDLDGKKDLVFQNLAFEYEDTGQPVSATVNRYVFANDLASVGSRDVYNLTVRNCRFESNGKAHGFLGFITTGDDLADSLIEDCVMDVTDFGIAVIDARRVVIQRNSIYTQTASQQSTWDAGVHVGDAVQVTVQENHIDSNGSNNFNRGVVLLIGTPRGPCLIEDNRIEYTDEIAIHTRTPQARIIGNELLNVHLFPAGSATHGQPSKVGIWVDHSLAVGTRIEQNLVTVYTPAVTDASIITTAVESCLVAANRPNQTIEIGNLSTARDNEVLTSGAASKILTGTDCLVEGNTATEITTNLRCRVHGNAVTDLILNTYCEVTGNRCSGKIGLFSHCVVTGNEVDSVEVSTVCLEVLFESNRVDNGMTASASLTDSVLKGNRWGASISLNGDNNIIEGNTWPYDGLADLGIAGNRNVVSGNSQYRYTSGMTLLGSDNNIEGNELGFILELNPANSGTIITGNNLTKYAAGISLQVLAANAVVANNHMEQTLYADGAPNSTFTGNVIESGDLQIGACDFITVTGNSVGGDAYVSGCASATVTGNSITGDLMTASDNPKILGNKVGGEINFVGSRPIISNNETVKIRSEGEEPLIEGNQVQDSNTVSGTSQGGSSSPPRIVLAVAESSVDDYYNGWIIQLSGGTGSGQYRIVTDYTGGTRVVYVSSEWDTNPDATTTYVLTPGVIHLATSSSYFGVVKGNQCSAGIVSKEANGQVIADNRAAGLVLEGVDRNRVTGNNFLYDISISSSSDNTFVGNRLENMTLLAGANNIIQGNRIDAELSITSASDFSTICGNYIGGNATSLVALTVVGTDDLTVIGNIFQNGRDVILGGVGSLTRMVFQGNRVDTTTGTVRINGSSLLSSSNSILVANNLVGDIDLGLATSCVVEGNKCGAILCVGNLTHVQNNHATGDIILGPGLEVLVEGNRCHNISCTGNNAQVQNNKLGGGNNITLTGASCIVTGNTTNNLNSSGGTCVLNSNIVQNEIRNTAASAGPRPLRVVTVGNLVFNDQIYGVVTGTHIAGTDHNEN